MVELGIDIYGNNMASDRRAWFRCKHCEELQNRRGKSVKLPSFDTENDRNVFIRITKEKVDQSLQPSEHVETVTTVSTAHIDTKASTSPFVKPKRTENNRNKCPGHNRHQISLKGQSLNDLDQ